jgi:hypothetical protein
MLFVSIKNNLQSLIDLLRQLSPSQYNSSCTALSDASIGSHYRHIIEMFRCLLDKYDKGIVNYDHRPRSKTIETNIEVALQELELLIAQIEKPNKNLSIEQTLCAEKILAKSNYHRELLFNLDHTIHHQPLIKIGVSEYDNIILDDNFGIAPSTLKYRKQNM